MSSKSSSSGIGAAKGLQSKSPAEFFADHQHIAGFDNPGKSLYTTVRELVENSLDACESIGEMPSIFVSIQQINEQEFNRMRGIQMHARADHALYQNNSEEKEKKKSKKGASAAASSASAAAAAASSNDSIATPAAVSREEKDDDRSRTSYFKVRCRDNGCGMPHASIPNMLGIVLSSTKYGVKQSRGKFGLGAKMALVWAKKSTGLPIHVRSATSSTKPVSVCKLDIDIYRNQPKILQHEQVENEDGWRGSDISLIIGGKWHTYQSKVLNYMRQLAVITPYAHIQLEYIASNESRSWTVEFQRRTDVMPPPPVEVKHHPESIDNLLVEQLIHHSKQSKLKLFLKNSFSGISASLADRVIAELQDSSLTPDTDVHSLSKKNIHQIVSLLKAMKFAPPDGSCLSPAGEYNLRLGIMKELGPDVVATSSTPAAVYEGHPFIVEAAVSVGGRRAKSGLQVYRYANRIPLLFEGGNDVVNIVARNKIKWSSYKLNQNVDKIGVFVSLVSTKIPFKGTSKEYIGDDSGVLHKCVKKALSHCCVQIKKRIATEAARKHQAERRKKMARYVPDVSRSFMAIIDAMNDEETGGPALLPPTKRRRVGKDRTDRSYQEMCQRLNITEEDRSRCSSFLSSLRDSDVSEDVLRHRLLQHVDAKDAELNLEAAVQMAMGDGGGSKGKGKEDAAEAVKHPAFITAIDTAHADLKTIHGEGFQITYW